jgi:hypothetical protein
MMRSVPFVAIALLACCLAAAQDAAYQVPEPKPVTASVLVGSYYFPGHFTAQRWVPMAQYHQPYPLLGYYRDGEPVVSDWHIKWAVEHGISFFVFDWYYDYKTGHVHEHNKALDQGFLRARYRDLMRFCIFWCNEEPSPPDYTEAQMLLLARTLRDRYLQQPNYLKFDGKAALFVSQPGRLIKRFGVEGCAAMWRKMSAEAGVELMPVAEQHTDQETLKKAGFQACAAYNYAGVNVPAGQNQAPYDTMVTGYEDIWKQATTNAALPYFVPVSPGWDSRPWYGDKAMVRTNPRPEKFRQMCEAAKWYVDPKLRAVIAECWNEFGEGSYIEPCTQYGFGYLDAMRDAFCPENPHHLDVTPQQLGFQPPVYDEIPVFTAADIAAQGGNMIYNPGFEKNWGWVYFRETEVKFDATVAHSGKRSAVVTPADGGMKSHPWAPVKVGDKLEIWAWVRTEPGATAAVKCALFNGAISWLQRYFEVGSAGGPEWHKVSQTVTWQDPDATFLDIEIAPQGGKVWVDDVGIRKVGG